MDGIFHLNDSIGVVMAFSLKETLTDRNLQTNASQTDPRPCYVCKVAERRTFSVFCCAYLLLSWLGMSRVMKKRSIKVKLLYFHFITTVGIISCCYFMLFLEESNSWLARGTLPNGSASNQSIMEFYHLLTKVLLSCACYGLTAKLSQQWFFSLM